MEGKTNFSRRLKQFDGLIWLTPTPYFTTDLRHSWEENAAQILWDPVRQERQAYAHRLLSAWWEANLKLRNLL